MKGLSLKPQERKEFSLLRESILDSSEALLALLEFARQQNSSHTRNQKSPAENECLPTSEGQVENLNCKIIQDQK